MTCQHDPPVQAEHLEEQPVKSVAYRRSEFCQYIVSLEIDVLPEIERKIKTINIDTVSQRTLCFAIGQRAQKMNRMAPGSKFSLGKKYGRNALVFTPRPEVLVGNAQDLHLIVQASLW
jgi:hypothetical protein